MKYLSLLRLNVCDFGEITVLLYYVTIVSNQRYKGMNPVSELCLVLLPSNQNQSSIFLCIASLGHALPSAFTATILNRALIP